MTPRELFACLGAALRTHAPTSLGTLPDGVARASVLVPLFEKDGEAHLLFLKRPEGDYRHAGQIAFPGGMRDGEETPLACALREANEEVGLAASDVTLLGELDEFDTVVTGFRVSPIVGVIPYPYPFRPDPVEVERLIEVPVAKLLDPAIRRVEGRVYFYTVGNDLIWGVTGGMLTPLLELIRRIGGAG